MLFYAHSGNAVGEWELLNKHLRDVAGLAAEFSEVFGEGERGAVAGLLHDLGKYGDLFQRRLRGDERGIDHWSAGAWACLQNYRECGVAMALAIDGHHTGLRQWSKGAFRRLDPSAPRPPEAPRPSETDLGVLLARLTDDGLAAPAAIRGTPPTPEESNRQDAGSANAVFGAGGC